MRALAIIADVICTLNEEFWLYHIVDAVFERREKRKSVAQNKGWSLGICILCTTVLTLTLNQLVLTSPYTVIAVAMESVILACCFWKTDILSATAVVGAYFFGMYLVASLEFLVTGMIGGERLIQEAAMEQNGVRVVFVLACGIIWLILNLFFYMWLKRIHINTKSKKYVFCISAIGLAGGSFIVGQMPNHFNGYIYAVWCFFLIAVMACIYGGYFMVKKRELQVRLLAMDAQNDMLGRSYEQVNEFYAANAKLYHDMNHHLDTLYHMLEQGNQEQAKQYIESLREPLRIPVIPLRTSIDMVDVILCEMEKKAERRGIQMTVDAQVLPADIAIEKKDLCALFANLLENAVEAAEREVQIQVCPVHQMLFVQVKNDYQHMPIRVKGHFQSTKKDAGSHGWGTQIIEQVVHKYEGSMEYRMEDGIFRVDVMVNMFV